MTKFLEPTPKKTIKKFPSSSSNDSKIPKIPRDESEMSQDDRFPGLGNRYRTVGTPDCWSLRAAGAAHCGPQNFLGVDYYSNSPSLSDRLGLLESFQPLF